VGGPPTELSSRSPRLSARNGLASHRTGGDQGSRSEEEDVARIMTRFRGSHKQRTTLGPRVRERGARKKKENGAGDLGRRGSDKRGDLLLLESPRALVKKLLKKEKFQSFWDEKTGLKGFHSIEHSVGIHRIHQKLI